MKKNRNRIMIDRLRRLVRMRKIIDSEGTKMNFLGFLNEYVKATSWRLDLSYPWLPYLGLGIGGESGEIIELIKKAGNSIHVQSPEFRRLIILEIGDLLWYLVALTQYLDIPFEEIMIKHFHKIYLRFFTFSCKESDR